MEAHQLHQQGKLEEAKTLYQELLDEDDSQIDVLHGLAVLFAQQEKYDDALKILDKALSQDNQLAALNNSKGNIYLRLKKIDQAISEYQTAIQKNKNYAIAYNNLGKAYYENQQLDLSAKNYQFALTLNENYGDAHYNLGILYSKLGDHEQAIQHLEKAIALNPHRPSAYGQLAEIYRQKQEYLLSIENYQKRLDYEPENTESYFALGQTYLENGQIDDAIAAFKKTLINQPQHSEANHYLGNATLAKGDNAMALNYYFRQLEINPMIESYYNIGVVLMHQNRHKESLQYLEQAAQLDPDYLPVHINLGAIYLKLNRLDDAIKHYQQAHQIKPDDEEIKHILAALNTENTPDRAPSEYLSNLFDQYANYYDKHLTEQLQYQAHDLLFQSIEVESGHSSAKWTILDLGCGTGLCGERFKPFSERLIGIDVSEKMIEVAKGKNLYETLEVMEVNDALTHFKNNDLILAGDVFSYIGKLDEVYKLAFAALKPGGLFAFTVEKTYTEPYELQKNIRYAHSKNYLNQLAKDTNFTPLRCDTIALRKQRNKPVEGYLVVLKRPE